MKTMASVWVVGAIAGLVAAGLPPASDAATETELQSAVFRAKPAVVMIAVRIGPDMRQAIVGTPDYFNTHPPPKRPEDLTGHRCINMRRVTRGGYFPWEFERRGREINVRVEGQLAVNSLEIARRAALDGVGLAYLPDDLVDQFREHHEADFAYSVSGVGRFRVNAYQARGTYGMVFRRVAVGAQALAELALPEVIGELALVL